MSSQKFEDYSLCYKVLGLEGPCSSEKLKAAYRRRVGKYHPDRVKDPALNHVYTEKLQEINHAYRALIEYEEIFGLLPPWNPEAAFTGGEPLYSDPPFNEPDPAREPPSDRRRAGRRSYILGLILFLVAGYYFFGEGDISDGPSRQAQEGLAPGYTAEQQGSQNLQQGDSNAQSHDPSTAHIHTQPQDHFAAQPQVTFDILHPSENHDMAAPVMPSGPPARPAPAKEDEDIGPADLWNPKPYNPVTNE